MSMTVVFLPGMICDAAAWRPQVEALRGEFEVEVATYPLIDSIGAMADEAVRSVPSARRLAVVGHSMGGRVAQEIVRRIPDRVVGLCLMGTDFRGPRDDAERRLEIQAREADIARIRSNGMNDFAGNWARRLVAAHRQDEWEFTRPIAEMALRHGLPSFEAHARAGANRPDYSELLGRIRCSTLIVAGADDALRPVQTHELMASKISGSRLVVLPRCGHMMSLEEPEAVSTLLRDWLRSLSSAAREARPS
jgi:pimeloyl-ACP methyl ester carboxylesterase